jgi:hypothetical protein
MRRRRNYGILRGEATGRDRMKPLTLAAPYTMTLEVRKERPPYAGAERPRPGESIFRFTTCWRS